MKLSAWGNYPVINSKPISITEFTNSDEDSIPIGNLRSYGDAALNNRFIPMNSNRFISFNETSGLLTCEAGVMFSEIIETFMPKGWFLSITPGTKYITVGGAIASDIHGKNHHSKGCFSECLESFTIQTPGSFPFKCSRAENSDYFYATCGGMGLTGIILEASFYLKRVKSKWINQSTIKTSSLEETFDAFEQYQNEPYSVAWIDCLSTGNSIGRSLINFGDFATDNDINYRPKGKLNIPYNFPNFILNPFTVKVFNEIYYTKQFKYHEHKTVDLDSFFYPLDSINNWNRIYGSKGFIQFQFILPKSASYEGLNHLLKQIASSKMGSFLAVLKLYGPSNNNWLSFPIEGYSLALDFKMSSGIIDLVHKWTEYVVDIGGRIYLTKDALQSKDQFYKSYENAEKFRNFREQEGLKKSINSLLSNRLDI